MTSSAKQSAQRTAAHRLLKRAYQILSEGWISGRLRDGRGGYCAIGALNKAARELKTSRVPATQLLAQQLGSSDLKDSGLNTSRVIDFNDNTGKESVLDLFCRAIKETKNAVEN